MRSLLLIALIAVTLVPTASGQLVGRCTLQELAETVGSCAVCPPGGQGYGNCTLKEVTYDAWCEGMCLLNRVCATSETQDLPVYILYECISTCDHPSNPQCEENPVPVQVLYANVPAGCQCTRPET